MRLDVKKYLFVGYHAALESFFAAAQKSALVHFINPGNLKAAQVSADIEDTIAAIKIVREQPTLEQEELESYSEIDPLVAHILSIKHRINTLLEESRTIKLEIGRIRPFGQFSLNDIEYIEKESDRKIQFFFSKKGLKDEKSLPEELIFINSAYGLDYFIAVNRVSVQYDGLIEMIFEHGLGYLQNSLISISEEIEKKEKELKSYAKYDAFLHNGLIQKYNRFHLKEAKSFAKDKLHGALFAVEGWVPANKISLLQQILEDQQVHMMEIAIEEGEVAPTYLENKGAARIGEDLVHVYDTPSNQDKDPSLWVLFSFAVFFSMIINDAGYGLVFLLAAFYFKFKKPDLKKAGLRVWKLALMLCSFCLVWGILMNSFFGMILSPDSPVRKVSVLTWLVDKKAEYHFSRKDNVYKEWVSKFPEIKTAETPREFLLAAKKDKDEGVAYHMLNKFSDTILMELALLTGMIHITLAFLRYLGRNWSGAGWILAIWGSYFYFPIILNATSLLTYTFGFDRQDLGNAGFQLMWLGLGIAVLLGIIRNKWLGLLEVTNIIQIFADILSYLRLYALGLAGAIISSTINDISGSMVFLGAAALLLVGHAINMVLAVVGGIIHGLRLNFIEWYHYSFEGGGKLFNPLRKIEIE